MVYTFARQRVTLCKDGVPERTVGAEPAYTSSISNALRARLGAPLSG